MNVTDDAFPSELIRRFPDIVRKVMQAEPNRLLSSRDELRWGTNGSLSVKVHDGTWFSHEMQHGGGVLDFLEVYCDQKGQAAWNWLKENGFWHDQEKPTIRIAAAWNYQAADGRVIYRVIRQELPNGSKSYKPQRPDGNGGWITGIKGFVDTVLYRLPDLGQGGRVYIVEGEKCVDRMRADWGVVATCNPGGTGQGWRVHYNEALAGAEVVILPDNDDPGRKHAQAVADSLIRFAKCASVRVVELDGLPDKGDIWDWMEAGGTQGLLEDMIDGVEPIRPIPVNPVNTVAEVRNAGIIRAVPPRQWLLGTNFCRGYLSGLTGTGGTGKTALRTLQLIALALGRGDLVKEYCHRRTRVLIVGLEDDEDEMVRRIQAACRYRNRVDQADLDGWLYHWHPTGLRFLEAGRMGEVAIGGLGEAMGEIIQQFDIGLVSVDPLVKSHSANENDNSHMDQVASEFLKVAHTYGAACDFVAHDRKGVNAAGDADRIRGASSIKDASRILKTLTTMDEDTGKRFGIDTDRERRSLISLDDAKINIAPPAEERQWYRLVPVSIGNGDGGFYPNGDTAQTVEVWEPPDPFAVIKNKDVAREVFNRIRQGMAPGEPWHTTPANAEAAWVGNPIRFGANLPTGQAKIVIRDWIGSGMLIAQQHQSKRFAKKVTAAILDEQKVTQFLNNT